jgi:RNA polymerase sigma-70 factor (ECF subfamily)
MWARALTGGGAARAVEQAHDELALCRRIAQGEHHLFGQILDRYSSLVAGVIAAQGVPPSDIEDLAQQAFISAYKGLGGFRGDAKLSSWLYRIALNTARGHLKRQSLRPSIASVEQEAETGQHPVDERRSSDAQRHVHDTALAGALTHLTEPQRTCIGLYYFEELSYEEIAEATGFILNTVRTHIRRGKMRLAELLDESLLD